MVDGILTLILLVALVGFLGYAYLFERLPEPVKGWQCSYCLKKGIGMKREMEKKGWDLENPYPFLCPDCRWLDGVK
jgi:hypothetical protein